MRAVMYLVAAALLAFSARAEPTLTEAKPGLDSLEVEEPTSIDAENKQDEVQDELEEVDRLIAELDFEIEEAEALVAKFPELSLTDYARGIRPPPKQVEASRKASMLSEARRNLIHYRSIGRARYEQELRDLGTNAAHEWVLKQNRSMVRALVDKGLVHERAKKAAGQYLTNVMRSAFADGFAEECERYANASPPKKKSRND